MKTTITLALCIALLCAATPTVVRAADTNGPQPELTLCELFVVTAMVAGAVVIIYVTYKFCTPNGEHCFVLEKSCDHSNWTPIATNCITITNGTVPKEMFRDVIATNDNSCWYRVRKQH